MLPASLRVMTGPLVVRVGNVVAAGGAVDVEAATVALEALAGGADEADTVA
jgi:hypothetical protein